MKKKIQSRDKAQWSEILSDKFLFYCICVFKRYFKFNYLAKGLCEMPTCTNEDISGDALPVIVAVLSSHRLFFTQHASDQLVGLRNCIANEFLLKLNLVPQPSSFIKKWEHCTDKRTDVWSRDFII